MLHITNGDMAADVLRRAVQGEVLPWRDVLHEGPVHAGMSLADLSRRRAAFIAGAGWAPPEALAAQFAARDQALAAAPRHDEVVLWFEHDLYDQLHLAQLLDWFAAQPHPRLSLVCEAEYLGTMSPARAADLFRARRPVSGAELEAASRAWGAFGGAASRAPGLEALRAGPLAFDELFARAHARCEEPVFLGDTVFAWHLRRLRADGLLAGDSPYRLTGKGSEVLSRVRDAWDSARAPRWLGGFQVRDGRVRWDPRLARLVRFG